MSEEELDKICRKISEYDNFFICGHLNHDGDCISSQMTLTLPLKQMGKNVINLLADTSKINDNLGLIYGTEDFIEASKVNSLPEHFCFITVDCAQDYRIEKRAAAIRAKADYTIIIDHHEYCDDANADIYYTNPDTAACSILCWKIAKKLPVKLSDLHAQIALVGIISDTCSFRNGNSNVEALACATEMVELGASTSEVSNHLFLHNSLASLQLQNAFLNQCIVNTRYHFAIGYLNPKDFEETKATKNDTTMLVDLLKSIDCVNFVCVLRQMNKGEDVHGSLRAKDDTDVRSLAIQYKGGGHIAAAGFTMVGQTNLQDAVDEIYEKMKLLAQGNLS